MLDINTPTGPFAVGQCDSMWMSSAKVPAAHGSFDDHGRSDDGAEGKPKHKLMVRMYYPVDKENGMSVCECEFTCVCVRVFAGVRVGMGVGVGACLSVFFGL